jgi:UPF0755 protein
VKKAALIALAVLGLIGLTSLGALFWWHRSLEAYARRPYGAPGEKGVVIPPGARMREVSRLLASAGVISDETRFFWLSRRLKKDRQIKAGEYGFEGAMLPGKVLEQIAQGRVKLYHCTVPEGLRLDEVAPLLERCGFGPAAEYLRLARDEAFVHQAGLRASSLEGYLFPDTYSFPKNPKPEAVLSKMVGRFSEEYRKADRQRGPGVELDMHQVATLASIVEKETAVPEERPRIACVFFNRLKRGMRLETDPTVIYAKILRYGAFDGDIRHDDLVFQHPYNTYTTKGLPPGPIASAGAAALEAALHPMACEDLFFVACGGGAHRFCPSFECHKRLVDRCQLGRP